MKSEAQFDLKNISSDGCDVAYEKFLRTAAFLRDVALFWKLLFTNLNECRTY